MAVFTRLTEAEVALWLRDFSVGALVSLEGISSGIENTNYFVTTRHMNEQHEFVLTIFERLSQSQLPFYLEFMRSMADHRIAVPRPIANRQNVILHTLKDKPCALATRLPGAFEMDPAPEHCRQVGASLARMHLAGKHYQAARPELMHDNLRGLPWWRETLPVLEPLLAPELGKLLHDEVQAQIDFAMSDTYRSLPRGPVHADLFRNNTLFAGTRSAPALGGFIDFYFAGVDTWLFDLAVTVNDWCIVFGDQGKAGELRAELALPLLQAYAQVQPFTQADQNAWPMMLRAAALRFWMSRLYDVHLPREAHELTPHDPLHFERILRLRQAGVLPLPQ